jgi:phosphoglycolate phosphatase
VTGLRLVVFDVDGTLVDSQDAIVGAMRAAFDGIGAAAPARATILSVVGLSLPVAMARLAPGLTPAARGELVEGYKRHHLAARAEGLAEATAPLYPGARDALDALAGAPDTLLGVATGKGREGLAHLLRTHGLDDYFVTAQTADGNPSKPHPGMLLAALAETGCAAERAVMVGDTEFDVAMGRAAGFATVGVAWGYHPGERLRAAGADRVIEDFAELGAAVAALGEAAS